MRRRACSAPSPSARPAAPITCRWIRCRPWTGVAHSVPLIIGNNAHEGRLFTRWLKLLPTNESMIEGLLGGLEPEQRERITAAYPGYPSEAACIRLGGDFASARRPGRSPRPTASTRRPTGTATTMRRARCTGRVSAPPMRRSSSPSSTCTAQGSVRCSRRPPTGGQRGGSATTCRHAGVVQSHRRARRRSFRLPPPRPCRDGVRPPVARHPRPARRPSCGLGRLLVGDTVGELPARSQPM